MPLKRLHVAIPGVDIKVYVVSDKISDGIAITFLWDIYLALPTLAPLL